VGHAAYLTVDGSHDVDTSNVKNYSNEGGHTCEGVDLCHDGRGGQRKSGAAGKRRNAREADIITDPYRSLVRAMSSEDIPLVIKSGEELPTGSGGFSVRETLVGRNADSGKAHRYRPSTACQNLKTVPLKDIYKAPGQPQEDVRTDVGYDNVRIAKVDHPDWGMTCGTSDLENITRVLGVMVSVHSNRWYHIYILHGILYGAIQYCSRRGGEIALPVYYLRWL